MNTNLTCELELACLTSDLAAFNPVAADDNAVEDGTRPTWDTQLVSLLANDAADTSIPLQRLAYRRRNMGVHKLEIVTIKLRFRRLLERLGCLICCLHSTHLTCLSCCVGDCARAKVFVT